MAASKKKPAGAGGAKSDETGAGTPAALLSPDWPAARVEAWPIGNLLFAEKNARTHSDAQIAKVARSITEWGWTSPILIDEAGVIIAGHCRVLAAKTLAIEVVPALVARGWTQAQKRAYLIADNKLALEAGWDEEILGAELSDLSDLGFDLALTGFDLDELGDLGVIEPPKVAREEHDVAAHHRGGCTRETPLTAKLYLGDSLEVMRTFPDASFSAVVTDPPYGLEFMGKEWDAIGRTVGPGGKRRERETKIEEREGEKWQPGSSYGVHAKNPRCMTCGKLRFDHEGRKCACETPQFHARASEYGVAMQEWFQAWLTQALRILKPGGMLLAFGGTRTYHRLACAAEDAGFEVRDSIGCLLWLYGQGFPKSLDVSKAIDGAAGEEREVVGPGRWNGVKGSNDVQAENLIRPGGKHVETAPATELAEVWDGYGTALKPAWEPIVVGMKPCDGTFAENAEKHGVAGLNIDAARIAIAADDETHAKNPHTAGGFGHAGSQVYGDSAGGPVWDPSQGRFPANLILDEGAAALLDAQSGERPGMAPAVLRRGSTTGTSIGGAGVYDTAAPQEVEVGYGDSGGASRFFYVAKASTAEREAGLRGNVPCIVCGSFESTTHKGEKVEVDCRRNGHPTVKPIDVMSYLLRLVTMPEGTRILDPFFGSGTGIIAGMRLGLDMVGIDNDATSLEVARWRILGDNPLNAVDVVEAGS